MALRGRIDGVFEGVLRAWLWDPDRPSERFFGHLLLDGQPAMRQRADRPRPDLELTGLTGGGCGLEFPLPIAAQDGTAHDILLQAEQEGLMLVLDQLSLVLPRRLHMLRGRAERVQAGQCLGWAWDQARPDQAVLVELLHGGRVIARQLADLPRADLARARIGDGRHGFAFDLRALEPMPPAGATLELRCTAAFGEWPLGEVVMPGAAGPQRTLSPLPVAPPPRLSRRECLAAARKAEGERNYPEAARVLDAGILANPDDFDLLSLRARVHLALQEMEPAERLARMALRRSPGHPRALVILARIATALGRHDEAVEFWAGIGPGDSAFRERLAKRARSLAMLGRSAEGLAEWALARKARPEDQEALRHMAEAAEAAGALRAARSHWRRLLALAPQDRGAQERLAALQAQLSAAPAPPSLSPLANPDLRDWRGPLEESAGTDPVWPAPGLRLRSLDPQGMGGRLFVTPITPQQRSPGELPEYGLYLRAEGDGAEIGFALSADAGAGPIRMALEMHAPHAAAGLDVSILLQASVADGPEPRLLRQIRAEARPRLHRFDLQLTEAEGRLLRAAGLDLVLRLETPGVLQLHPPRALARLATPQTAEIGFETPFMALPIPPAEPADPELMELACPFTSISILAVPEAMTQTIRRILEGTAAAFECVVTLEPGWPESLIRTLHALAAQDPRLRILPAGAASATGWLALVEMPPAGDAGWLAALHRDAARQGRAEAPGVVLEWCG
ncbi:tetratricopeptide repeat protein [Sediminicoccus sp. KRV36]|uniref:tetratricopeptide repeat protein n=1 Tax=Sediminicoccus sp. KRV36 TaxID=3133721 RepID=UPI00200E3DCB|nr:tetratricopeptide repeat protein [Sediminicoccus rosea]UPY37502.1 tetratricopeptide repeat protein [Sediminicoccus rosea]